MNSSPLDRAAVLAHRMGGTNGTGEATMGGVAFSHIARQVGTPFYAYHGETIQDQIRRVRGAVGPTVSVYYSLKANPSLGVCQVIAKEGVGAEAASSGELAVAEAAGFPAARTLFAGPGKTDAELVEAVRRGIRAVNVESSGELARLAAIASRLGRTVNVGVRVNPSLQVQGAQMRMGGGPQQFGIDEEQVPALVEEHRDNTAVRFAGLHVYAGTQAFDVEALLAQCHHTADLAADMARRLGQPLEVIDFGGGFGVPYFAGGTPFDLEAFGAGFQEVLRRCADDPLLAPAEPVIELGRYLVAEAGVYVTRVVDVKTSRGTRYIVTDGGMNHHITATGNFGQVFRKAYPLALLNRMEASAAGNATIVGPCCTPLDTLAQNAPFPSVAPGDLIGVYASGAYGYSASSLAFLSHPTPAEAMVLEGEVHVLRNPGRPEQALMGQRPLALHTPARSSS